MDDQSGLYLWLLHIIRPYSGIAIRAVNRNRTTRQLTGYLQNSS